MLTGPYAPRARAIAAELRKEDVVTVPDCDCKVFNDTYYGGAKAEYYQTFDEAALAYAWHKLVRTLYWGVHLKGLHIVHIHSVFFPGPNSSLTCPECKRRRAIP
ncbi:MAG: hypothetical protein V3S30_08130 [Thermoanaerobaculia bacterium]